MLHAQTEGMARGVVPRRHSMHPIPLIAPGRVSSIGAFTCFIAKSRDGGRGILVGTARQLAHDVVLKLHRHKHDLGIGRFRHLLEGFELMDLHGSG